jgi:NADH-quinone oxidoreductase subunit L
VEQTVCPRDGLSGIWLLVAIPLASARPAAARAAGRQVGALARRARVGASFVLGLIVFFRCRADADTVGRAEPVDFIPSAPARRLRLLFDPLSGVFVLLITGRRLR